MNNFLKYVPLLSGMLLFVGYFNYATYYGFFGLDITSYLTTGELVLSFLPLTLKIVAIFTAGFLPYFILSTILKKRNQGTTQTTSEDSFWDGPLFKDLTEGIDGNSLFSIFFVVITIGLSVFFGGSFLNRIIFDIAGREVGSPLGFLGIYTIILFSAGSLLGIMAYKGIRSVNMNIIVLAVAFMGIITFENKGKADVVLSGHPFYAVDIAFKDSTVHTDSNFVFVGKTNQYVFFRNLKEKKNKVYAREGIISIETKELP
jgi:hypothetical protein